MNNKICFKCNVDKPLTDFYKHPGTTDGHLGKCKECAKLDAKKRTAARVCTECSIDFMANPNEVKRRGGQAFTCSRACYYKRLPKLLDAKFAGKRGYFGLHNWVYRQLGQPNKCEMCLKTTGKFEWSNISGVYKEDIADWQRLCIKCHRNYDQVGTKGWITKRANKLIKETNYA